MAVFSLDGNFVAVDVLLLFLDSVFNDRELCELLAFDLELLPGFFLRDQCGLLRVLVLRLHMVVFLVESDDLLLLINRVLGGLLLHLLHVLLQSHN